MRHHGSLARTRDGAYSYARGLLSWTAFVSDSGRGVLSDDRETAGEVHSWYRIVVVSILALARARSSARAMASSPPDAADDAHLHDWPAVYALSAGWALSFSVVTASITATNLASSAFSPSASWNTVLLAFLIVSLSAWSLALPSLFARLGGRLNTYRATSCVGVVTSAIAAAACATESFGALCVSSALRATRGGGQSFRVLRCSRWSPPPPRSRPKCIGLVLTGGIVGAVLGPAYAAAAKDLFQSAPFAGVYLCTGVALALLLGVVCAPGLVTFPSEGGDADADRAPAFAAVRAPTVTSSGTSAAVGMATADVGFRCAVAVAVAVVRRDVFSDVPHAPVDARARLLLRHHRARHHEPHARHVCPAS